MHFSFEGFRKYFVSVFFINSLHGNGFSFVATCFVVQHHVCHHLNSTFMEGLDAVKVFFLCSPPCSYSAFLIKFSKVEQIVNGIPGLMNSAPAFVSRREPYI